MILVFLLFILISICLVMYSSIKLNIENFYFNSKEKSSFNYNIKIGIYLFNKYKILEYKFNKNKISKMNLLYKLKDKIKSNINLSHFNNYSNLNIIKKININIEKFNLNLQIGTEYLTLTSLLVVFISSIIASVLSNYLSLHDKDKNSYIVTPIYNNSNIFKINLNCIISVKLVHIIYVIFIFSKKRSDLKNERASNRGSYDYSYE